MNWIKRAWSFVQRHTTVVKAAVVAFVTWVTMTSARADTPPLDLTATGVTVAGYIAAAATAGVAILAALYGIRVIIRAFKSVK
jgi:hypothetical protein